MRKLATVGLLAIAATFATSGVALAARATWSPSVADFGRVPVGQTSAPKTFTLTAIVNNYPTAPQIRAFNFNVISTTCGTTLSAGASCTAQVDFAPRGPGPYEETLEGNEETGSGIAAEAAVTGYGVAAPVKCKKKKGHKSAVTAKKRCKKKK